jgi:hypothetical protein
VNPHRTLATLLTLGSAAIFVGSVLAAGHGGGQAASVTADPCRGLSPSLTSKCKEAVAACNTLPKSSPVTPAMCLQRVTATFDKVRTTTTGGSTGSITTMKSPNGSYSISVTNSGIVLKGPAATIKLTAAIVEINGAKVKLNGCAKPVARVGDVVTLAGAGTIAQGSPTVCAG